MITEFRTQRGVGPTVRDESFKGRIAVKQRG